jgi:hypothetical protein
MLQKLVLAGRMWPAGRMLPPPEFKYTDLTFGKSVGQSRPLSEVRRIRERVVRVPRVGLSPQSKPLYQVKL